MYHVLARQAAASTPPSAMNGPEYRPNSKYRIVVFQAKEMFFNFQ